MGEAHTGIHGNETADRLATEGTGEIVYDKKPRETIITEGKMLLTKWQDQWTGSTKVLSKLFFPYIYIYRQNEDYTTGVA